MGEQLELKRAYDDLRDLILHGGKILSPRLIDALRSVLDEYRSRGIRLEDEPRYRCWCCDGELKFVRMNKDTAYLHCDTCGADVEYKNIGGGSYGG